MTEKEIHDLIYKKFKTEFENLYSEYNNFNSHTNISAIRNKEDVFQKHFLDSLSILILDKELDLEKKEIKLIDIGTGGGFPAIPLAICKKNFSVTAVDSVGKKLKFIDQIKEKFKLTNLITLKARSEELAHNPEYRESFDLVVARAVAELEILIEICGAFVKVGGFFVAYKKTELEEDLSNLDLILNSLGFENFKSLEYSKDRQLIIFKKIKNSATKYPRSISEIKKSHEP